MYAYETVQMAVFHCMSTNLYKLLQQCLQVFSHSFILAEFEAAKSLGEQTNLRGCRVLQNLSTNTHRKVVMDTHLLKTCIQAHSISFCLVEMLSNCKHLKKITVNKHPSHVN